MRFKLDEWRFLLGNQPEAFQRDYDDSAWQNVRVPHDWAVSQPFDVKYSSGTGYLPGGTGWYRTSFALTESDRGQRVFLCFDGVYKNSQVWCNSYYLGKRPNGYVGFQYDVTDFVRFDGTPNVIAVKVTHEDIADSRWYTGSGITRKVMVNVCDPVYVPWDGLFFTSRPNKSGNAQATVKLTVVNETSQDAPVWAKLDGFPLGGEASVPAHSTMEFELRGNIESPRLWSVEAPNLYTLTVSHGEPIKVGIRDFAFDPDKGFSLNGQSMKIKGVCVHHDAGCLGAAVWPEVWRRRLIKLKAMGCNAIRTSHNPHMPELYDLCDEMGFLMMGEAFDEWEGPKNKWIRGHNVYPPGHQGYYEDFPEWHERDLSDMVKRDRNHPSVIMWSIGNEIDYPNDPYCHPLFRTMVGNNDANKPAAELQYNDSKPNAQRLSVLAEKLAGIVRRHDTTRPVLACAAFPELSTQIGFFDHFDMLAYNYKEHLYEQDHKRFPRLPIIGSENGHSPEAWQAVADHAYVCGQFLWTGIDYMGEAHGWPVRGSRAGLLTLAGFEKPEYYQRAAMWTENPPKMIPAPKQPLSASVWEPKDDLKQIEITVAKDVMLEVSVEGGELMGLESGDLSDTSSYALPRRRTYEGHLIAYVLNEKPGARVTIRGEGLAPVVVKL